MRSSFGLRGRRAGATTARIALAFLTAWVMVVDRAPAQSTPALAKAQRQYQQENDPVRKSRLLVKLGELEIDRAATLLKASDEREALSGLQYYRDEVRKISDLLTDSGLDPAKRPAGFKDLQIALRENIRRLDDIIFSLPVDDRPGFEDVRAGLSATQAVLFEELFPTPNEVARKKR